MNEANAENPENQTDGQEKKKQQDKIDNAASNRLNTKISDSNVQGQCDATKGEKKSDSLPTDEEIDQMVEKGKIERENLENLAEKNPVVAEKLKNMQKAEAEYRDSCEGTVTGSKEGRNRAFLEVIANVQEDQALSGQTEEMSGPDRKVFDSEDARTADRKEKARSFKKAQTDLNEEVKEIRKKKIN